MSLEMPAATSSSFLIRSCGWNVSEDSMRRPSRGIHQADVGGVVSRDRSQHCHDTFPYDLPAWVDGDYDRDDGYGDASPTAPKIDPIPDKDGAALRERPRPKPYRRRAGGQTLPGCGLRRPACSSSQQARGAARYRRSDSRLNRRAEAP